MTRLPQRHDLRAVQREFIRQPSPRIIGAAIIGGIAVRVRSGRVARSDFSAVVAVAALQPIMEWGLHRFALHAQPRRVLGMNFDPARDHRRHHENPHDLAGALLRTHWALTHTTMIAAGTVFATRTIMGRNRAASATAVVGGHVGLLMYEWMHFLAHTRYRPRTAWAARVRANHRRHHWADPTSGFGITSVWVDRVLTRGRATSGPAPAVSQRLSG